MSGPPRTEIRSYRSVFELERRIYRVDSLRLNPTGVPVRGVAYALGSLAIVLTAQLVPLVGDALGLVPWPLRFVALPLAVGTGLYMLRVDGRPGHAAAMSIVRHRLSPPYMRQFRSAEPPGSTWSPDPLLAIADGASRPIRRVRFMGPGAVLVRGPHRCSRHGARRVRLTVTPLGTGGGVGRVLQLPAGARLDVRS